MRGRNARKKAKPRKGPRTSADIRQEIAELDEEGFREDEARNAQAAKIQARIRGRKARREAAPKRAALQRARADARALADKVAALEAENARLRQAASPPSGAKTPNTEDDWEQCVDETTGHTYYYSSSRDASRWEMPSAWKEGGPKDDWEQCESVSDPSPISSRYPTHSLSPRGGASTTRRATYYFSASRNDIRLGSAAGPRRRRATSGRRAAGRRRRRSGRRRPPRGRRARALRRPRSGDAVGRRERDDYETPSKRSIDKQISREARLRETIINSTMSARAPAERGA